MSGLPGAAAAAATDVEFGAFSFPPGTPRMLLGLLVAYPVLMFIGFALIPTRGGPAVIWPADAALFLAFLVLPVGRWLLVGVVAAVIELVCTPLASYLMFGRSLGLDTALAYFLAHVLTDLGPVIIARGLRVLLSGSRWRAVASPVWMLSLVGGVLPGAILGNWLVSSRDGLAIDSIGTAIWMFGTTLGIVLFAPALTMFFSAAQANAERAPGRRAEAVSIAVLIALIFGWRALVTSSALAHVPSLMLLMFPLSWLALRFSCRAVYLACPLLALAVAGLAAHGFGSFQPLAGLTEWQNPLLNAQLSLLAVFGAALFISTIQQDQRQLYAALQRDRARLRWYAAELDHAEEAAQQRTAADLHDGIAQTLTGQSLLLAALRQRLSDPAALAVLGSAEAAAAEAQQHIRDLVADLSPVELDSTNLRELIDSMARQFEQRYQFPVLAAVASEAEVPADTLRLVYRVVRELIFNAFKHSQGTRVTVHGQVADGRVIIEVFDDGIGFARATARPHAAGHGLGLIQMRERVAAAGGSVQFGSRHGIESLVSVVLPFHLDEPAVPPFKNDSAQAVGW